MPHLPSVEDENRRRRTRERERLVKERTAHTNRIKALLFGQGIRDVMPLKPGFIASPEQMRSADGRRLPPRLKEEIIREHERLCLVAKQLAGVEAKRQAELRAPARGSAAAKIAQLVDVKSTGAGPVETPARRSPSVSATGSDIFASSTSRRCSLLGCCIGKQAPGITSRMPRSASFTITRLAARRADAAPIFDDADLGKVVDQSRIEAPIAIAIRSRRG